MNQKLKVRAYAIFQFISFSALIVLLIAMALIAFVITGDANVELSDKAIWGKYILEVLGFAHANVGIAASVLTYTSFGLFVASWISGWMIFRVHNRNLFDSLFLLFLMLPIISNVFALFGQVATKEIIFMSSKIDKKAIVQEQTRIIMLNKRKEARKAKALNEKRKEAAKAKEEEAKKQEAIVLKNLSDSNKPVITKKPAAKKKPAPKKPVAKKPVAKKAPVKKATPKKVVAKKPAAKKKAPVKKPVAKKPVAKKKAPAKKTKKK